MVMRSFYAGVFIVFCAFWSDASAIVIPILREGYAYQDAIDAAVPQPITLQSCTFQAVGFVERAELFYLAGLAPGRLVAAGDLKKAAACFQAKKAFSTINLIIEPLVPDAISVRWQLERCWLVERVKIQSNVIGKQVYRALYTLEPGDPFDQEKHETSLQAIRDMLAHDGFERAQVSSTLVRNYARMGVAVKITIKRGPRNHRDSLSESTKATDVLPEVAAKNYIFEGNHFFSHADLMTVIRAFGESADLVPDSILIDEIERAYHAKGFWQVHIARTSQNKDSIIVIKEGARARIDRINLVTKHKKAIVLIDQFFTDVLEQKFFDEQMVAAAVERVVAHYVQEGFFDIRVAEQEYHELADGGYALHLVLDEGEQGVLVALTIPGFEELEKESVFSDLRARMPLPCTTSCIQSQQQWLVAHFHALGYEHPVIKPEFKRSGAQMTIVWQIEPGKKVVFGKTIVIGNGTLPINYVLRELTYKQGDRFDPQQIKESLKKLKELELFDCIRISPCCMDDDLTQERMLALRVYNDTQCQLSGRAGFGLQQVTREFTYAGITYNLGASCQIKNPFSVADRLCIDAEGALGYRNFAVSYRMPWLGKLPVRTLVQGYTTRFQYPGITDCDQRLYEVDQGGALLGFSKQYQAFDGALTMGVERMRLSINTVCCPGICSAAALARALCIDPALLVYPTTYAQGEPTLFIDFCDNRLQPTRGSLTMLSAKVMVPLTPDSGRQWFAKFVIDESFFIPMLPCVFAGRVRLGHIFNAGLCAIMPTERFYLGGANSVRGYASDLCPPLGTFCDTSGCVHKVARGGCSMLTLNGEVRFPLYKQLSGAVFQDMGVLWANVPDACYGLPVAATGFGLRYATPIGPLRFDIGWKWRRDYPDACRYAWFLTFGHAF